ncbi:WD repeat and HMG-box DNA-binding protein 1 [Heracleum sosnowskyi]|uniref:WD repeat and HMG-box DNA-binding protein 1 n=1 Tax=Heracleum sosnowskyi TaxID=360622 RepID=A0AAD8NDR2_9APIA|nr:WD repeat and HMG-box DNA-binding protein 1 [Heracleum sosnowskyi]
MKIRSMKLREAHKNNGVASQSSIVYDIKGERIVTALASDASICIHDAFLSSVSPKVLRNHRDGVTCLAISPNSTCLASGSIDHSVKLYKFPGGEFETNITRFTLPIRSLAFNKSGTMLAAAGDDEGIKLINTIDGSVARVLKGHRGSVTGISFDPKGEYLASVDSVGTVIYWELHNSGIIAHNLKGIAPSTSSDSSIINILQWSPDGEMLAVPGLKNDVVMYDRDTAEKLFTLRGDHVQPVCFLSWSPNGKYMATSGLDRQILIWNVDQKQDIDRQKFEERICCMAWKPNGNALAFIDAMGKYGVWESTVPSSMKSPTEGTQTVKSNGVLFFDEDEQEPSASGSLSDMGEDSFDESEIASRKRLRQHSKYDEALDEDNADELNFFPKAEPHKKPYEDELNFFPKPESRKKPRKEKLDSAKEGLQSTMVIAGPKLQEAFQPGSTPVQPGKRRFLCYNMLGSITSIDHDGYSHIEIDFHDTGSGPRVPAMTDYFGFTMASLNENGSVFANPRKGEKNMSTLMYRPFSSWANNSEWSMRFEEEEVRAVALGNSWVAAVTSLNFLRIFTEGGLQKHVLSLDGPVVTVSGSGDELAVVTHSSSPLASSEQMLEFRVFNICSGTLPKRGKLPITPGSSLTWFGFSEEGQLSSFDSKGVLRVFSNQYGGSWLPLFSASKLKKPEENYWVAGLNMSKLFCIVCKSPDSFPQVIPKPVLTLLDLSCPLASSDLGADNLENEFICNNVQLCQIQSRIDEMLASGQDTSSLDDEAFSVEAVQDRCILRLIASCCNGDKLVRATELVKLLSLEKSVRGAIKLVTALKLPNLAERFNLILEERLQKESMETPVLPRAALNCDTSFKADVSGKTSILPESSVPVEPAIPASSEKFPTNPFTKKTLQEPVKAGKAKTDEKQTTKIESKGTVNNLSESKNSVDIKNAGQTSKVGEGHRPSNPFAKSSNNQEKSSLLDSLKKMKNDRTPKK